MRAASGIDGNASSSPNCPTPRNEWDTLPATGLSSLPTPVARSVSWPFRPRLRDSPLAGILSMMPHQLQRFGDMVVFWWETATPIQFLSVALTIVILGWFVSKLGS